MNIQETIRPWYKEPLVWLVISLPASAIVAGIYTLFLAIVSYDGLVVDDYYKQGLAINKRLEKDNKASLYGLAAQINTNDKVIELELSANEDFIYPHLLTVTLSHATKQGYDQTLLLKQTTPTVYAGEYIELIPGRWNVIIEQNEWRLLSSLYNY